MAVQAMDHTGAPLPMPARKTWFVEEAAEVMGVPPNHVYELLRTKQLLGWRAGKRWLIRHQDLDDYMARAATGES